MFDIIETIGYNLSCLKRYAILAQLVEQLICNQQVVGSSPTNGSKSEPPRKHCVCGGFAFVNICSILSKNRVLGNYWVTIFEKLENTTIDLRSKTSGRLDLVQELFKGFSFDFSMRTDPKNKRAILIVRDLAYLVPANTK